MADEGGAVVIVGSRVIRTVGAELGDVAVVIVGGLTGSPAHARQTGQAVEVIIAPLVPRRREFANIPGISPNTGVVLDVIDATVREIDVPGRPIRHHVIRVTGRRLPSLVTGSPAVGIVVILPAQFGADP